MVTSREETARRELGHTDISPPLSRTLTVVFLLTIAVVPAVQTVGDLSLWRQGDRDTVLPQSADALRLPFEALQTLRSTEGGPVSRVLAANRKTLRSIHAYEDRLKERSLVGARLRPRVQAFLTGALGAGNEEVYCGRDGWLFYRPAVEHLTTRGFLDERELERRAASGNEWREAPQPNPLAAIGQFRDQLADRGIELLVVPVPVKASIHPEFLSRRFEDATEPVNNPSFPEFLSDLADRRVRVVDPTPLLWDAKTTGREPQYLQTDTHWTPQAMDLVAAGIADAVREVVEVPENDGGRFKDEHVDVSRVGDLVEMLELPAMYPQQEIQIGTVRETDESPNRAGESADVLLLGDSFANIFAREAMGWGAGGGLAQRLSTHLQRPVDALIRNNDGAFATRLLLSQRLSEGHDVLADTRVVIWEFTSRELSSGDWRLVPMEGAPAASAGFFVPPRGVAIVVEGTVAALAEIPDPQAAPYADYIVGLHLVDLSSASALDGREALVFTWAMQDRQLTAGAGYRPGQRIRLELRAWADVGPELESVSRGELYDADLLFQSPCWGEEPAP